VYDVESAHQHRVRHGVVADEVAGDECAVRKDRDERHEVQRGLHAENRQDHRHVPALRANRFPRARRRHRHAPRHHQRGDRRDDSRRDGGGRHGEQVRRVGHEHDDRPRRERVERQRLAGGHACSHARRREHDRQIHDGEHRERQDERMHAHAGYTSVPGTWPPAFGPAAQRRLTTIAGRRYRL
jgi:hypothetical protein